MSLSGWKVSSMLLGKSGGELIIAPERMKWLGQSRNDAQLWTCLVMKIPCCKEQYCIGTSNIRSMHQGKLDMVNQEMARINIDILGISGLKWMGMGKLIQMTIISTTVGKESHRINGVALIINKRVWNAVLG